MVITGIGDIPDYASGGAPWYAYREKITALEISRRVHRIGRNAFAGCSNLMDVYYPDLQSAWNAIAVGTGNDCLNKAQIHVYYGYGEIGTIFWVLDYNGKLTISGEGLMPGQWDQPCPWCDLSEHILSVVIEPGVTSIGKYAFYGCSSLSSIEIPAGVTSIGREAFHGCSSLSSIELPAGVTSIGDFAFYNCNSLTNVTIPSGVTYIGNGAFITYGGSLRIIYLGNRGDWNAISAESGISDLEYVTVSCCEDLLESDGWNCMMLPDALTVIEEEAFAEVNAEMIIVPADVTEIGAKAFARCIPLRVLRFMGNPQSIADDILNGSGMGDIIVVAPAGGSAAAWAAAHGFLVINP